jgi:hypothetical protein
MRTRARFDTDTAWFDTAKEVEHLRAPQGSADDD